MLVSPGTHSCHGCVLSWFWLQVSPGAHPHHRCVLSRTWLHSDLSWNSFLWCSQVSGFPWRSLWGRELFRFLTTVGLYYLPLLTYYNPVMPAWCGLCTVHCFRVPCWPGRLHQISISTPTHRHYPPMTHLPLNSSSASQRSWPMAYPRRCEQTSIYSQECTDHRQNESIQV